MGPNHIRDELSPSEEFLADPQLANEVERISRFCVPTIDGLLFRQGQQADTLYYVRNGEIALWMEAVEAGRMVMCVKAGAGSLVGLPAVVGGKPYSMTAAPCVGADIREISRDDFQHLLSSSPALATKVLKVLAAEVRMARQAFLQMV